MKNINYPYFAGAMESFLLSLAFNDDYNAMTCREKKEYIESHIKKMEQKAIEYNETLPSWAK